MYTYPKILHKCRTQNFWYGPLIIFPLDGQIKWVVIVGTKNGDNLGGSRYLYL